MVVSHAEAVVVAVVVVTVEVEAVVAAAVVVVRFYFYPHNCDYALMLVFQLPVAVMLATVNALVPPLLLKARRSLSN